MRRHRCTRADTVRQAVDRLREQIEAVNASICSRVEGLEDELDVLTEQLAQLRRGGDRRG